MYGLVNSAISGYLKKNYGTTVYHNIAGASGVVESEFVSMETYPDEITYNLVVNASKLLDLPVNTLLESIGQYWVTYTAMSGYGKFFSSYHHNIIGFLENLNLMHMRLMLIYPEMKIPTFNLKPISELEYELIYESERFGLAHFVIGLVKGLSEHFSQPLSITHIDGKSNDKGVREVFRLVMANQD
jgi:hypothetical protein